MDDNLMKPSYHKQLIKYCILKHIVWLTALSVFVRQSRHQKDHVLLHPATSWDVAQCSVSAIAAAAD